MKAVGLLRFGGPEVLEVLDRPDPHVGAGEIRIRVRAAAVNPVDALVREGRIPGAGSVPFPHIPGMDVSGVVDEIGPGVVGGPAIGDRVIAVVGNRGGHGGYSELVVVPFDSATILPAGLGFAAGASFLMNALAASEAVTSSAVPAGSAVLITGAAGAVGGHAVELAAVAGHRVVAVADRSDESWLREGGAAGFVASDDAARLELQRVEPAGFAAVIDAARLGAHVLPWIRDSGVLVSLRQGGVPAERGIREHVVRVRDSLRDQRSIAQLGERAARGLLRPRVASTLPMSAAGEAHRRLGRGGARGRHILLFDQA